MAASERSERERLGSVVAQLVHRHNVDITDMGGGWLDVDQLEDRYQLRIRSRPWFQVMTVPALTVVSRPPEQVVSVLNEIIAKGAAALRGAILRDLILNWNDYPLDIIERNPAAPEDEVLKMRIEIAERLAVALLKIAKDDLAERIGMQLLEGFRRGIP